MTKQADRLKQAMENTTRRTLGITRRTPHVTTAHRSERDALLDKILRDDVTWIKKAE